ncbi:heterogeneous nuclear ribonucleoprotein 27C-like isoform X2 [Condylostylus longicornis]|uniref:heterogeneous nuclear ribonucleoprotein 27C-like isoform X2 n=1 Tax=Condylostylus longicornis TaxID=2530218 RepID=UPI00244DC263|nr:heterogeneous nuclear ribonucleoprotein 27C-like isoform X2 [Condylostylus longicornis]
MRTNQENGTEDDEKGKLFVGGLSWETTHDNLQRYFCRFGEVIDCVVMKNNESGRSRGFGFVTFADPNIVDCVLRSGPHSLDGRTIDPKICNPRTLQKPKKTGGYPKVFLGGLPSNITETDLRLFFGRYGKVMEIVIMYDQEKKKSRGFGFLSFQDEVSVERITNEHFVNLNGKQVEIKKAEPRDGSHTHSKINNANTHNNMTTDGGNSTVNQNASNTNVGGNLQVRSSSAISMGVGGISNTNNSVTGISGHTNLNTNNGTGSIPNSMLSGQNLNDSNHWGGPSGINHNNFGVNIGNSSIGGSMMGGNGLTPPGNSHHLQNLPPGCNSGPNANSSNNGPLSANGKNGNGNGPMSAVAAATAGMLQGPNGQINTGPPMNAAAMQAAMNAPNMMQSYQGWGTPPQQQNYNYNQPNAPGSYQGWGAPPPGHQGPPPPPQWNNYAAQAQQAQGYQGYGPNNASGNASWNSWSMQQSSHGAGGTGDMYTRAQSGSGGPPNAIPSHGPPPNGHTISLGKTSANDFTGYGNGGGYGNFSGDQTNSYGARSYGSDNGPQPLPFKQGPLQSQGIVPNLNWMTDLPYLFQ